MGPRNYFMKTTCNYIFNYSTIFILIIISTKNSNVLPSPLIHGKHIHFVDGSKESIKQAITEILANSQYRKTLEKNARKYYLKYLSPNSVIQRIIDFDYN